jgi:hypothetical protein
VIRVPGGAPVGSAPVGGEESSSPVPQTYDPDLWTDELAFLGRPGQADIQIDLFYDYRTNVASYPAWQQ